MPQLELSKLAIYGAIIAAVIGAAWGAIAWHAKVNYDRGYEKAEALALEANKERLEREMFKGAAASKGRETDRVRIETVYEEIEVEVAKVVERPVYLSACFDDDGLRLANAALRGEGAARGEPDGVVPAAEAAREQLGQGIARQAGGSLGDVLRLPKPASPAP